MNKFFKILVLLLFPLILLTGCSNNEKRPFVAFSNQPITENTTPQSYFKAGTRVYYAAVKPKGFNDKVLRIQIFKQDDKVNILGYSYQSTKDYRLENDKYYTDYFVIYTPGHYYMQVFEITNLQKPVILGDFWIVER